MNPGDLVTTQAPYWLYGGTDKCWDENNNLIPTNIPFGPGDIGLILSKRKMFHGRYTQHYFRILTPHGIGWVFERYLEAIK